MTAAHWSTTVTAPHYISENKFDMRGIKSGWYAIDDDGNLPPEASPSPRPTCYRLLKTYNVSRIEGDHYAGSWPVEQFRKFGILYEPAARPKSELYVDLLPLINSRRIQLLDDVRLMRGFGTRKKARKKSRAFHFG
jgi:hypothetical protein